MKQKTRILIYILIAAAAVIMGVIAVFSKAGGGASAAGHIDLGRTYLIELSYDNAVIEFTEAIRIDPNNVDAYLGLAEAYEKLGDTDKAIEWLEKGFELTGDERVREMLDRLRGSAEVTAEQTTSESTSTLIDEETTVETVECDTTLTEEETAVTPMELSINYNRISLGYYHSAAVSEDGSLYLWGENYNGQLGNGKSGGESDFPYEEGVDSRIPIKILDNVASVSLGWYHSAAITEDGSLYMWGANFYGQLGNGTNKKSNTPINVLNNAVSVSLGEHHSAAITKDGSLYMWGDNFYGQLGNGNSGGNEYKYDEDIDSNKPIKVLENVVSVSLGENHSAAITKDGSLYMWGYNVFGQCGNSSSSKPQKVLDNVASISLGCWHSAAITTDGSLYMWGHNQGRFTDGTHVYLENAKSPIKILDNVVSVSLGVDISAAITTDGCLYTWGDIKNGSLGNGSYINCGRTKILDNIASVSLGYEHGGAVTTDGKLYMWGGNGSGQLGTGGIGMELSPIQITLPTENE